MAVIDDEPAITEFIAELMQGLQYRVSAFTDPRAALAWCRDNCESIDLVIVDHTMPAGEEGRLIESLLALPAEFSIVVCSDNADRFPETSRTYLCHKPIDISELTQIVSDLLQDT